VNTLRIGSCVLGDRPRIAAAISGFTDLAEIDAALGEGVDLLEIRADLFPDPLSSRVDRYLDQLRPRPVLLTIRQSEEGGRWPGNEPARMERYFQLMPMADAVDVELRAPIVMDITHAAKARGRTVIASYHNFNETPEAATLEALLDEFRKTGADILKIAAWCHTQADTRRLAAFLCSRETTPMIVLGMGPAGRPTRLLFPFLGSLVTYTYLGTASAPGQLNHRELTTLLEQIQGGVVGNGSS